MRRFLSIWFPTWPTDRWRRRAEPVLGPLALTASGQGGIRLTAVDEAASAIGLSSGMTLADARALAPHLLAAGAEPESDAASLAMLADWASRYSPWSAVDGVDGIRLDITGCAHLSVTRLPCSAIWSGVSPGSVSRRTEALPTRPHLLGPGRAIVRSRRTLCCLRAKPSRFSPCPSRHCAYRMRWSRRLPGLACATSARLPRFPARRSAEGSASSCCRGSIVCSARSRTDLAAQVDRAVADAPRLAEPIGRREDIDAALLHLLERLCRDLSQKGRGARRLDLAFYCVDATVHRLVVGTSRPTHDPAHLMRLFTERLDNVDPGFGIEAMALEATETEILAPLQTGLAGEMAAGDLALLIDRLQNRLGRNRVVQLVPVESHVPERAEMRAPALSVPPGRHTSAAKRASRPLKLLLPPEPIDATAPIPDDPPLSFRWRRIVHRVAHADGPSASVPNGGDPTPVAPADYYRVEDTEGRRFWVYREGLYGAKRTAALVPHGFFHELRRASGHDQFQFPAGCLASARVGGARA